MKKTHGGRIFAKCAVCSFHGTMVDTGDHACGHPDSKLHKKIQSGYMPVTLWRLVDDPETIPSWCPLPDAKEDSDA